MDTMLSKQDCIDRIRSFKTNSREQTEMLLSFFEFFLKEPSFLLRHISTDVIAEQIKSNSVEDILIVGHYFSCNRLPLLKKVYEYLFEYEDTHEEIIIDFTNIKVINGQKYIYHPNSGDEYIYSESNLFISFMISNFGEELKLKYRETSHE